MLPIWERRSDAYIRVFIDADDNRVMYAIIPFSCWGGKEFLNGFFYFCIFFAFLVTIPLFLIHL
jgi:hypothetical protein